MIRKLIILPIALVAFACAKDDNSKVDDALNADLSTAAQANPVMPLDSVSAMERNALVAPAPAAAPVVRSSGTSTRAPVRRTSSSSTRRRSTSSGSTSRGSSGSSGGTYSQPAPVYSPAPEPQRPMVKNTKRDAIIGGAAGAVLGAATSKNKVKGAVIGGTAGAIIGGVIGNNVDKSRR